MYNSQLIGTGIQQLLHTIIYRFTKMTLVRKKFTTLVFIKKNQHFHCIYN